ncbi:DNA polymerase III PolC-type [Candidatus Mycoplasma haematohominis]|uniref:DNA polymerase III PolC-type n=1 Tax=Candidatus Mycoplasma haematohominis TaxID=1494318 RepID=A0A478FR90_9MOLU|nr:DNA polymerase III PolC-type [Candidatus Mycoplasma haemohominis]
MKQKYAVRDKNFPKLFIEYLKIFNEKTWATFLSVCKTIKCSISEERKHIRFDFFLKDKKIPREVWTSLVSYCESSGNVDTLILKIAGLDWDVENVRKIINSILESKDIEVSIDEENENKLIVTPGDKERYEKFLDNNALLVKTFNYLFDRKVSFVFDKEYQDKEEEYVEREYKPVPKRRRIEGDFIEGEYCCFKLEERLDLQKKIKKFKVGITDFKNSYWLSIASKKPQDEIEKLYKSFEIDSWYKCKFSTNKDPRFASLIDGFLVEAVKVRDFDPVKPDESKYGKAYALCTHTKNSAFDGLYTAKELVREAVGRGHEVIGLTDSGSLQSYSEFESALKEAKIKGMYGVELEVVADKNPIIIGGYADNWLNRSTRIGDELCKTWDGETYSILDIETTGFNPLNDEIIQISVQKFRFKENKLEDVQKHFVKSKLKKKFDFLDLTDFSPIGTFDKYVKTINKKVSQKITDLTGISQKQIDEIGLDIVDVLKDLKEFVKGSIIVAHNGISFDIPFINAHLRKHKLGELEETVLDTLKLSHYLFQKEKFKSHALSALCKKASINYDDEQAHNASYDVTLLSRLLFTFMIPHLQVLDNFSISNNLKEINNYFWKKEPKNRNIWGDKALIYVKNQKGIKDIYKLVSLAHTDYYQDGVKIIRDEIDKVRKDRLIIVSNPFEGEIIQAILQDDRELFRSLASWYDYIAIPPISHFELEIKKQNITEEEVKGVIRKFIEWAKEDGCKWFFSYAVRYIDAEKDKQRYSVLVNIKGISGKRHYLYCYREQELRGVQPTFDFKYSDDFFEEYSFLWKNEKEKKAIIQESLDNQNLFIESCDSKLKVIKKTLHPPKVDKCSELLQEVCKERLMDIYGRKIDDFLKARYEQELKGLIENDFSVVYWVSYLLVKKSLEEGYLVGSRGSVGSSFIAFLMGISEVNPLPAHYFCRGCGHFELVPGWTESGFDLPEKKCPYCANKMLHDGHDIPFETFLGFGGDKVPDIDLNFSGEYQIKAHNFLKEYFGEDRVFRAGTIGAMAEKTAFSVVDEYEQELGLSLNKGTKLWLSSKIVDVKRTTGQHPGGILVIPEDKTIYDFTPINYPANDLTSEWYTTHFAFDDLHDALLKFDILGHDDPTALALLKKQTNFDPLKIPNQDPELIRMYRSCEAMGIKTGDLINGEETGALGLPEFGTVLTRKIIKACQPQTFADLMRISGFSHGIGVWKGNIELLVKDKEKYPLNKVITCRDDIMLYLIRAGLSTKDAFNITEDIRKGKGLKKQFEDLMREKGVPDWYINSSKNISYIFPKAHATAYVMMSWKIAYYKLYYPLSFYSSYFSTSVDSFDLEVLIKNDLNHVCEKYEELQKKLKSPSTKGSVKAKDKAKLVIYEVAYEFLLRGFKFANVCVNRSEFDVFVPIAGTKELRIPLKAVDGLGEHGAKTIIEGRKEGGLYRSIFDLQERANIKGVTIEKLRNHGIIPDEPDISKVIFDDEGELIK